MHAGLQADFAVDRFVTTTGLAFGTPGGLEGWMPGGLAQPWPSQAAARNRPGQRAKAGFDVVAAAILLVLLAPLLMTVCVMIWSQGGPALFRHRRLGRGGRSFECLKFRSMRVDADRALAELLLRDPEASLQWAAFQKLNDDPRIHSIGRFLRRTSLDELPQLFNVLRGEMSLVGPRPIVNAEISRYGEAIHHYCQVRPGLTGLWQVSGRSNTTYARRVELDQAYVLNWSFLGDFAILLRTIPAMLLHRGAR